jgi:hypothetical protein
MTNTLPKISKVSFPEEFSFEICNNFYARSNQNGTFLMHTIYGKGFMIFGAS